MLPGAMILAAVQHAGGAVPFAQFMELCLHHPEAGYYTRGDAVFGRGGDFYTASDLGAVYGRLMCRAFEAEWRRLGAPAHFQVVDAGAGRGAFAADVLQWGVRHHPEWSTALHYVLLERSPALRAQQQQVLANVDASRYSLASSLDAVPEAEAGCILANEFFDALPIDLFSRGERGLVRAWVEVTAGEGLELAWRAADADMLESARCALRPMHGEDVVEAAADAPHWVGGLLGKVRQGALFVVDYGYMESEWERYRQGTLRTFRRHQVGADPLQRPGEQDLTAHVNFTALVRAAGPEVEAARLCTLHEFLRSLGESDAFAGLFADLRMPAERVKRGLQLRHLVSPAGLGEAFQVLVLRRAGR